jgi:hypothetical protein
MTNCRYRTIGDSDERSSSSLRRMASLPMRMRGVWSKQMMRDDGPARAIPAGFYVGRFGAEANSARVDADARTPTTSSRSLPRYQGRWVSRTGLLLATAAGVLGGMLIGQFESIGGVSSRPLAQVQHVEPARITVASEIAAQPSAQTALQVRIDSDSPREALANSYLHLRGLPPAISLSQGQAVAPGAWVVPLFELSNLAMNVPVDVSGRSELDMTLVASDGTPLAKARTTLEIPAAAPRVNASSNPVVLSADVLAVKPNRDIDTAALPFPILTPQQHALSEKMVARGQRLLDEGSVALAREFFRRAADAGIAKGALLLAATYDSRELTRLRVLGVQPNAAIARTWYQRARQLGAAEADARLAQLTSG